MVVGVVVVTVVFGGVVADVEVAAGSPWQADMSNANKRTIATGLPRLSMDTRPVWSSVAR